MKNFNISMPYIFHSYHCVCHLKVRLGTHHLHDRGPFSDFAFLAMKHVKMTMIVIRISARAYIHSLSCIAPTLVEIFEVSDRWVVSDVWVDVFIRGIRDKATIESAVTVVKILRSLGERHG